VEDNEVAETKNADVKQQRTWRQYMNRFETFFDSFLILFLRLLTLLLLVFPDVAVSTGHWIRSSEHTVVVSVIFALESYIHFNCRLSREVL
jgi:hypothetical protein